jgi:dCTP deaminase
MTEKAQGGILSDSAIKMALEQGTIKIDPFTVEQLNPVSYDLTLGDEVLVYKHVVTEGFPFQACEDGNDLRPADFHLIDVRKEPEVIRRKMTPEKGWLLKPGVGYLMHTRERVYTRDFVPIVDGKSSIGRLFIQIHFTAGFGDPNFDGQYTLEVSALHPVRVFPGMRIGQIRFHTIDGAVEKLYAGNYTGEHARGAVASQAWRQFKK